ncbi:MAG: hypothetical protein GPJ52_06630 [Candidatus Heimdallarchaeota archaeon]|nr:hypothetical protein [Candidatus Heimdallarchaeota archaeon]
MKFEKFGIYAPEAINELEEIQPLDIAQRASLARMNYIIGFFEKKRPKDFDSFIKKLQKKYAELSKKDYCAERKYDITKSLENLEYLQKYKELAIHILNYVLLLLDVPEDADWVKEKIKVLQGNYLQSFLVTRYQNASILSEVIGREEAIKLYKIYRTEYAIHTSSEYSSKYETVEELRDDGLEDRRASKGWVRIEGIAENGKYFYRRDSCIWADAISDLPDSEFRYLAACYGDYEGTKIHWNPHFVLTMGQTVARGDPYCSCIVHDTRIDWDLTHPPKEFWDGIWPLHEWQKKKD